MGPIWPAIKSAFLQEYLRACCSKVSDFEDAENRTAKKRKEEKKKLK